MALYTSQDNQRSVISVHPDTGKHPLARAVIFDLDGVLVSTEELHFQAWRHLSCELGIELDRRSSRRQQAGDRRLSLEVVLGLGSTQYGEEDKCAFIERKNTYYRQLITSLSPRDVLPGVLAVLSDLQLAGVPRAVGSSSRNARTILQCTRLIDLFDTVVDGTEVAAAKPDPALFLLAARRLHIDPGLCIVVEDALIGVEAALSAGMGVVALGDARTAPGASLSAASLAALSAKQILAVGFHRADTIRRPRGPATPVTIAGS